MRLNLNHQAILHNAEPVTYLSVAQVGKGGATTVEIGRACRLPLTEQQMENPAFAAEDLQWSFGRSELEAESVTPKPGDRLTACDGTETWVVMTVTDGRFAGFWRVSARNLSVAFPLSTPTY